MTRPAPSSAGWLVLWLTAASGCHLIFSYSSSAPERGAADLFAADEFQASRDAPARDGKGKPLVDGGRLEGDSLKKSDSLIVVGTDGPVSKCSSVNGWSICTTADYITITAYSTCSDGVTTYTNVCSQGPFCTCLKNNLPTSIKVSCQNVPLSPNISDACKAFQQNLCCAP